MEGILIEKIQHAEYDEVAGIMTDAFETNPAYSIIFKNKDNCKEGLLWLFKANLIIHNYKETLTKVIKEKESGKIIGTFTLVPPGGTKTGFSVYRKIGIQGFISKFGLNSLIRMLSMDKCNKTTLEKSIKEPQYHYLSMVVIREECRGTGIGTYAIQQAIRELTFSKPTCKLMALTTQLPENILFYSRLGFTKLNEGYINFKDKRYYNYSMSLMIPD